MILHYKLDRSVRSRQIGQFRPCSHCQPKTVCLAYPYCLNTDFSKSAKNHMKHSFCKSDLSHIRRRLKRDCLVSPTAAHRIKPKVPAAELQMKPCCRSPSWTDDNTQQQADWQCYRSEGICPAAAVETVMSSEVTDCLQQQHMQTGCWCLDTQIWPEQMKITTWTVSELWLEKLIWFASSLSKASV